VAQFTVQFSDSRGKIGSETIEASSEKAVIVKVEASGRIPISIREAGATTQPKKRKSSGRLRWARFGSSKVRSRELLDFTHQLTAVVESGIPIVAGLKAISEQTENENLRSAINKVIARVEDGRTLADAMSPETDAFPRLYVKTVAAGEAGGKVAEVLAALTRYQEQEADTRGRIKSAMMYPALVVASLVLATTFMLVFVVPQFAKLFERFKGQLPVPTKILLAVSGMVVHHYVWLIAGLIGAGLAMKALLRVPRLRSKVDEWLLRLPVFGNLLLGTYMVRFIELLDLLMQAALPITQALRVTAESTTNTALRRDVAAMQRSVEGGRSLADAFARTRWLTPLVKRMLAVGEQAGRTDQIFAYLRKYYTNQTKRSVKLLSTLIEPVMVTSLAAVVLFFALAIFLPMWRLLKIMGTA
jgi:MSHA biogenesis protein MshG